MISSFAILSYLNIIQFKKYMKHAKKQEGIHIKTI